MTKKEKELLSKDFCARLYYGIKGLHRGQIHTLKTIDWGYDRMSIKVNGYNAWFPIDSFKPYLRSMSSMTEEEEKEFEETLQYTQFTLESYDWLLVHHFDYRGLIEKGLALEAQEEMYKTK